jgi:hypothetical protein
VVFGFQPYPEYRGIELGALVEPAAAFDIPTTVEIGYEIPHLGAVFERVTCVVTRDNYTLIVAAE